MLLVRAPSPPLRAFVRTLWASDGAEDGRRAGCERERVLPNGEMHLVFRLCDTPLRVYADLDDPRGEELGLATVGGARSGFYLRDVSAPARSVGASLAPGVAELLFGAPAGELAERHTPLEALWGRAAAEARERLCEALGPERQLGAFEALLAERLPRVRGLHPAVAEALARLGAGAGVRATVASSGYSHRRFVALFREAVGLAPKRYSRVLRFQRALERIAAPRAPSWVDLALGAGYSDQSHFDRDFRGFSGVSPTRYRALAPLRPHHLPVPPAEGSTSSKTRRAGSPRIEPDFQKGDPS